MREPTRGNERVEQKNLHVIEKAKRQFRKVGVFFSFPRVTAYTYVMFGRGDSYNEHAHCGTMFLPLQMPSVQIGIDERVVKNILIDSSLLGEEYNSLVAYSFFSLEFVGRGGGGWTYAKTNQRVKYVD